MLPQKKRQVGGRRGESVGRNEKKGITEYLN